MSHEYNNLKESAHNDEKLQQMLSLLFEEKLQVLETTTTPVASSLSSSSSTTRTLHTNEEDVNIVNTLYAGTLEERFKTTFPFHCEGIVLKSIEPGMIDIYTYRLGKIVVKDFADREGKNYAYFLVREGMLFSGFSFFARPRCLQSEKSMKNGELEMRGYGIVINGDRESEKDWKIWNDVTGLMEVLPGSSRLARKKSSRWNADLDVISFISCFESGKFKVKRITELTYIETKMESQGTLPSNMFLLKNCHVEKRMGITVFVSERGFEIATTYKRNYIINFDETYWVAVIPYFKDSQTVTYECAHFGTEEEWRSHVHSDIVLAKLEQNRIELGINQSKGNNEDIVETTIDIPQSFDVEVIRKSIVLPPPAK